MNPMSVIAAEDVHCISSDDEYSDIDLERPPEYLESYVETMSDKEFVVTDDDDDSQAHDPVPTQRDPKTEVHASNILSTKRTRKKRKYNDMIDICTIEELVSGDDNAEDVDAAYQDYESNFVFNELIIDEADADYVPLQDDSDEYSSDETSSDEDEGDVADAEYSDDNDESCVL